MKGLKMLLTLALVIMLLCSFAIPALAYADGDREVLYYNFEISNGARCGVSSNTMKRLFNRQWVVTISSRSGNSYPITYGMLDKINSEWDYCLCSYTTPKTGTGNIGGNYYSSDSVGAKLWLGTLTDERDVSKTVKTSGQWSTDNHA